MRFQLFRAWIITLILILFISCHGGVQQSGNGQDTVTGSAADSTGQQIIPGSPGPKGTSPRSVDTTRKHRDSLKKEFEIADTAGHVGAKR